MNNKWHEIYDALAPHYRDYSNKKSAYLSAVNRFILENIPYGAESLLDVGAGDGVRGMYLAKRSGIKYTVLTDVSREMIARCRSLNPSEVWQVPAQQLMTRGREFDVIICLWNVLGHLPGRDARIQALKRMGELLSSRGLIFFDINNRHNGAAYGRFRVLFRAILDFIKPNERRGDVSYNWTIANHSFPAFGHLFTPAEIQEIISESGLTTIKRVSINYTNGAISTSPFAGQLVFMVKK